MTDVNILANHINQLIKRDRQMSHAHEQHGSHISSFMKVVNRRLDKLIEGMQLNYKMINELKKSTTIFHKLMTNISMVAFDQISKSNEIQIQLVNVVSSVVIDKWQNHTTFDPGAHVEKDSCWYFTKRLSTISFDSK